MIINTCLIVPYSSLCFIMFTQIEHYRLDTLYKWYARYCIEGIHIVYAKKNVLEEIIKDTQHIKSLYILT